ncbi:DUF2599 domain-containing protein [Sanguibacter suaedae]|uniref:DUF2599 domain-containing protein n=1 Tax=Sanguibacter suaedae TaxID=2795737 RepID=A0A934I5S6_9MICO|nr:DUF2599 domain-containing protein [Sanguibacter suaedae]MBI9115743.1 DUF2599 domain-containing protein [Sanguibacter suaedae]
MVGFSLVACSPISSPAVQSPGPDSETNSGSSSGNDGESARSPESSLVTLVGPPPGTPPEVLRAVSAQAVPDAGSGLLVTATVPDSTGLRLEVAAPEGAAVPLGTDVVLDGTLAVTDVTGDLLLGVTEIAATDAAGVSVRGTWTVVEDATTSSGTQTDGAAGPLVVLDYTDLVPADASASLAGDVTYPVTVDLHVGSTVVDSVLWDEREGGRSLVVSPSAWGRVAGATGMTYGFQDVVRLEPAADTQVMEFQLLCHLTGAPDKDTWNLEPWRPEVSYLAYLAARCNPT